MGVEHVHTSIHVVDASKIDENKDSDVVGGILDLVLDDRKSESVEWMPSPYSDHFVIIIDI